VSSARKFRITLWDIAAGGWRGNQKAVVFDASAIGVEEHANDVGSAFWTLHNAHPQIAEFVPLARHYEISRWSYERNRWEFVGAGMLNDYTVTEFETTFAGIDYKHILNMTYTPLAGMSVANTSAISPDIGNFVGNSVPFKMSTATATTALRFLNDSSLTIDSVSVSSHGDLIELVAEVDPGDEAPTSHYDYVAEFNGVGAAPTYYYKSPYINLQFTVKWSGTSTNFPANSPVQVRVFASPPGVAEHGSAPLDDGGLIGEFEIPRSGAVVNGSTWDCNVNLYPYELDQIVDGSFGGNAIIVQENNEYDPGNIDLITNGAMPLRTGATYSFQVYAAIYRTNANNTWYRTIAGLKTDQITLGQSVENASVGIASIFSNAITSTDYHRLRYSSLSVSGSTSTSHTLYSAGEPVLDHIAAVCDLEMGAKTNGDKVIFGISKPTAGASYDGTFKLNLSVSSTASTAMALRYPENIKAFSFSPGYSRVRNDVTIIPSTSYLAGTSGQSEGVSVIGASAVDSASISSIGRISLIVPKGGLVDANAASNEANRLLTTYKSTNTKQANIAVVLDGVDLWNGWDVGDSIRLTIKRGLADIDEPFVISGVRWFGESDGHERVELDLVQGSAFNAAFTAPVSQATTTS